MIHFILIDDCYPINTRNRKILASLAKHYGDQAKLSVITWDRNNDYNERLDGYFVYQKESAYGNKTRKLFNLWGYRKFCRETIRQQKPDVVIASHWNNLLMVPKLDRKRQMFIYENLDVPTESYIFRKASSILEHLKMRQVDLTIHASRFFPELYSSSMNQLILENKPTSTVSVEAPYSPHRPIRAAFIGTLRYREILSLLIDAIRGDERFELYFHGDGHARQYLEEYTGSEPNVFFTGKYAFEDVARLYRQTDVVWAAYPNKDFNVKYAISNKFHESLMFGVPAIYSDHTRLGDFVEANHVGMKVDPYSKEAIKQLLDNIATGSVDLAQMHHRMIEFHRSQSSWDDDFKRVLTAIEGFFPNRQ